MTKMLSWSCIQWWQVHHAPLMRFTHSWALLASPRSIFSCCVVFSWSQKSTNLCCLCVILGYEDLDNLSAAWCYLELGVSSLSDRHTTYCLKCVTHGCKRSTKPPPPQDTSLFKDLERTPPTCPLFKGIKWICIHLPTANRWMLHVCIRTLLESDQSETSSCF